MDPTEAPIHLYSLSKVSNYGLLLSHGSKQESVNLSTGLKPAVSHFISFWYDSV